MKIATSSWLYKYCTGFVSIIAFSNFSSGRNAGMTFVQDGKLIKVLDASHHKPGKGNTVMRMKLRDVRSG
jgi:translation elongation factor P/translation initiation factor 5A